VFTKVEGAVNVEPVVEFELKGSAHRCGLQRTRHKIPKLERGEETLDGGDCEGFSDAGRARRLLRTPAAGVRKPPMEKTAVRLGEAVRLALWGFECGARCWPVDASRSRTVMNDGVAHDGRIFYAERFALSPLLRGGLSM
jgi:hypothetical protein